MVEITGMTIKEAHEGLSSKKFSAKELVGDTLKRIDKEDKGIRAYLHVNESGALETASTVDKDISSGNEIYPLAGIPVAVKDNILVMGIQATAGSQILKDYVASY